MAFVPSSIRSPSVQQGTDLTNLDKILTERMEFNPKGVMEYIRYLREDDEAARQKVSEIEEKLLRSYKSAQDTERKRKIEEELPRSFAWDILVIGIFVSVFFTSFFSYVGWRIATSGPYDELMRKHSFAILWHCVISCSILSFCFIVGFVQGCLRSKISPSDLRKQNITFGVKRRAHQFHMQRPHFLFGPVKKDDPDMLHITLVRTFADYVGNTRDGSPFSNWRNIGSANNLHLDSITLCCLVLLVWKNENDERCVGPWSRVGFTLIVLAMAWTLWVTGKSAGWFWRMGRLAQRLRKNCLSQDMELEKGEAAGRDRLEVLVRELLQEENIGEKEKSPEGKVYEETVACIIVKRIRC